MSKISKPLDMVSTWSYTGLMESYKVSQLKTHLSQALRQVKKGSSITIFDRETPVANLVPFKAAGAELSIREPLKKSSPKTLYAGVTIKGLTDIQELLHEDRNRR